jgi:hypothetical protein
MQTRYLLELSLLTVGLENWRLRSLFVLKGGVSSEITELVRGRVWIDSAPTAGNHNRGFVTFVRTAITWFRASCLKPLYEGNRFWSGDKRCFAARRI